MSTTPPAFLVGPIPVYGDVILSPMDGFSDLPFRSLARRLGSAMSYTEFVSAIHVEVQNPELHFRLDYDPAERPVVFQLYGDDPERIFRAAMELREQNPDILDINMGCAAKAVAGRGAGAGLLRTPEKIKEIFARLTRELDIPVTGKIRLGWDEEQLNYLEIAKIIEDNGGSLVAVHGRTKEQGYSGVVNRQAIAEIKAALSIPVIGNGDVQEVADIAKMKAETGCDAVMIGRAAIGNPWIFSGLDRREVSPAQVRETMLEHLESMLRFYGSEKGLLLFRKHAKRYISVYQLSAEQNRQLMTSESPEDFTELLADVVEAEYLSVESKE